MADPNGVPVVLVLLSSWVESGDRLPAWFSFVNGGAADYTVMGGSSDGTCKVRSHLVELEKSFQGNCATLRVRSVVVTFPIEPQIRDRDRPRAVPERFPLDFPLPDAHRGADSGRVTY